MGRFPSSVASNKLAFCFFVDGDILENTPPRNEPTRLGMCPDNRLATYYVRPKHGGVCVRVCVCVCW
eukprot:COSAG01_NODE_7482_length_3192_cov_1.969285_4_plen_67_part_00